MKVHTFICDKDEHLVLHSWPSDSTPDCPLCHHTMEAWPHEMETETVHMIMEMAQEEMSKGERNFHWYNVTQTVVFHTEGRIDIQNHETLDE